MNDEFTNERSPDDEIRGAAPLEPTEPSPEPQPELTAPPPRHPSAPDRSARLLQLAEEYFGHDLTDADRKLLRSVANGEMADFSDPDPAKNDPAEAEVWGNERVIQAECIRWLCTDSKAREQVLPHVGIFINGARIDGSLPLYGISVNWGLRFDACRFKEKIRLAHAVVAYLSLDGSQTQSVSAQRLRTAHGLFFRNGFRAEGEVDLKGASIGGNLECTAGKLINPGGYALNAERIEVGGSVFLRNGFEAQGEVRLANASIGGRLNCRAGKFINPKGQSLVAYGIKVHTGVFLTDGFEAQGEVRLPGASIGQFLTCEAGKFINPGGQALIAFGIKVDGGVFLRDGFNASGLVDFTDARVDGLFHWRGIPDPSGCQLRLTAARVGTLCDEEKSWAANIHLDGFVYDRIHQAAATDAETRRRWLKRQPENQYLPQPYNQLAKVLQEMGHEEDARKIRYAKVNDPKRLAAMSKPRRFWHRILRITIRNGYYPERALIWAVFVICAGTFIFGWAGQKGSMILTSNSLSAAIAPDLFEYWLDAFFYSLDAFIPLVDLHQVSRKLPTGIGFRAYFWIHILAGWSLTTLLVVGFTGLVRK